jgi:hypothetical protein
MTTKQPLALLFSVILGVFFLTGCDNNKDANPTAPTVRSETPIVSTAVGNETTPVLTSGNPGSGSTQSVCTGVKGSILKTGEELFPNLLRVRVRVVSEGDNLTLNVHYGSRVIQFTNGKEDWFEYDRPNAGSGSKHESLDLKVLKGGQQCWTDKVDFQVPEKEGPGVNPNPEPETPTTPNPGPEGPRDPLCADVRSGVHCTVISKTANQVTVMFTNASSQMQQVNLHPYKVFGVTYNFPDMESQVRYAEGSASANLAPNSSATLTATLPDCAWQLDAYIGPTVEKAPHRTSTLLGYIINIVLRICTSPSKCDPTGLQIQDTNGETTNDVRKGVLHVIFADNLTGKVKVGNNAPVDVRPNQPVPYSILRPEPGQPDAVVEAELTTYENGVLCGRHVIKIRVPAKPKPEEPKEMCPDLKTDITLAYGEVPDQSLQDVRTRVLYSANWVGGQMDGVFNIIGFGERGYRKGNPPNAWDFDRTANDYNVEFEFIAKTKEGLSCPVRKKIRIPARPKKECKLVLSKLVDQNSVRYYDQVVYTLNFRNAGNGNCTGSGVLGEDNLGDDTRLKLAEASENVTGKPKQSGNLVTWSMHELKPGETGWVRLTVRLQAVRVFYNNFKMTAQELAGQWVTSNTVSVTVVEEPKK